MEKREIEKENTEIPPVETLLEEIPDPTIIEEHFDEALSIPEDILRQIRELGGNEQLLMERLKPVFEKIKNITDKIRSRARKFVLVAGVSLFAYGLVENSEIHKPIGSSNNDPQMVKERSGAYVEGKSEWFAEHIQPFGYTLIGIDKVIIDNTVGKIPYGKSGKDRYDAWYLYLGLEQENGTFEVSPYKPTTSSDAEMIYYRMPEKEEFILRNGLRELEQNNTDRVVVWDNKPRADAKDNSVARYMPKDYSGLMGRYTVSKGEDEKGSYISYYDKWDLKPGGIFGESEASEMAGVGKPFEIYGRIYYDPKTGEPVTTD